MFLVETPRNSTIETALNGRGYRYESKMAKIIITDRQRTFFLIKGGGVWVSNHNNNKTKIKVRESELSDEVTWVKEFQATLPKLVGFSP